MGIILPGTTAAAYYGASGDHGAYQYLKLDDIVDAFVASYVGPGKICENVNIGDVWFHAGRALQELHYDTLRSVKTQEIELPPSLVMLMPRDFVNHVKFSWSDASGIEHVIYPGRVTSNPIDVEQDADGVYQFSANVLNTDEESKTWGAYKGATPNEVNDDYNDGTYWPNTGGRHGIEPEFAQNNGTYFIDYITGKIHFSSNLSGKTIIIEYISDGLGDNQGNNTDDSNQGTVLVPKLAEEAMYKHIAYACASALTATPPHVLQMLKKERFAETRKAKLRLSNIKIEELTQVMRGKSKFIKH